jgi:hypothetical protein
MRIHTMRGRVEYNSPKRLILDDGQFTRAHRVVAVHTWPASITSGVSEEADVTLALDYDPNANWDASDNRQIGWAGFRNGATASSESLNAWSLIDPDHIVVRDLYIINNNSLSSATNYMVILEEVAINENEAVLALIKERSQDDLR